MCVIWVINEWEVQARFLLCVYYYALYMYMYVYTTVNEARSIYLIASCTIK